MKTYIFTWYDEDTENKAAMRLNEKQAELIDYLFKELAFDEVLEMGNVTAKLIDEAENNFIDLT
jgi:capsule polysaccharide export protein KpsE/RkpR